MTEQDRRGEIRGVREERLFVRVADGGGNEDLSDTTISCSTLDVSASGLRLFMQEALAANTRLELWVEVKGCPGKFFLQGVVRWCCPKGDGFNCGIELEESEELSDLTDWQDLFL